MPKISDIYTEEPTSTGFPGTSFTLAQVTHAFGKQLHHYKLLKRKRPQSEKVRGNWTGGEQEALSRLQRVCADVDYAAGPA